MDISYQKFSLGAEITAEQQAFFTRNGFIHFKKFINPEKTVADFIRASEKVQQNWITNKTEKINGVPIKYGKDLDGALIVQRFAFINVHHTIFSAFTNKVASLKKPLFGSLLLYV